MSDLHSAFKKVSPFIWEVEKSFRPDMRVPARIFASNAMMEQAFGDRTLEQLINVATLPGIQKAALAMPDAHEGYGFPIGGVAAMEWPDGVISPGGIGYDINCGVRLIKSEMTLGEVSSHLHKLAKALFHWIPSGVGKTGKFQFQHHDMQKILTQGAQYVVKRGWGSDEDLAHIESEGHLDGADGDLISKHAFDRGEWQLGTMGAGNHFVEVDCVTEIFDEETAKNFGLFKDQIVLQIHTGSRGLGHQVATDYIRTMTTAMTKYEICLPDRELACVPFSSEEGQNYFKAMNGAANFAFANRQLIAWEIKQAWEQEFGPKSPLSTLYDVAHNLAKIEEYEIDGKMKKLIVHRKGATRAFPGQPVLIPGSMGTASYVLVGQPKSLEISFGSSCHGAGRAMSRHAAKKKIGGRELLAELESAGIAVEAGSYSGLAEEAPFAYKNVDDVVNVVDAVGIAKKVCKLKPCAVIKG